MLPDLSPVQHVQEVQRKLIESITKLTKHKRVKAVTTLAGEIKKFSTLPNSEGATTPTTSEGGRIERVRAPAITTTTTPTAPNILRTTKRVHQRITRANAPNGHPTYHTRE